MKRILLSLIVTFGMLLLSVNSNSVNSQEIINSQTTVYICKGAYSKCYHKTSSCKGLKNCSTEIERVSLDVATTKYNRRPCGYCYNR